MPAPTAERQALERERAEPPDGPEHRDRLDWQIRNCRKRLAAIEARLAAIRAEGS